MTPATDLPDARLRARVATAWGLLLPQSDDIADTISTRLLEEDAEGYERLGPELRADLRESTRVHIRRGLEVLRGDGALRAARPSSCGARPAAAGRARACRWSSCSTPTRSGPGCSGRP